MIKVACRLIDRQPRIPCRAMCVTSDIRILVRSVHNRNQHASDVFRETGLWLKIIDVLEIFKILIRKWMIS